MAIQFTGASTAIELPNIVIPDASTGIVTYTFWTRADALPASGIVARLWGSETHHECRINASGLIFNDVFESDSPGTSSTTPLTVGIWAHLGFTADANIDVGRVYFNGVLEASVITHTGTTVGTSLSFGTRTGTPNFYNGAIDDWRKYNRILNAEEINTIFLARGHDGITEGLEHRFVFTEGSPGGSVSTLVDIAGGGGGGSEILIEAPTFEESELSLRRKVA